MSPGFSKAVLYHILRVSVLSYRYPAEEEFTQLKPIAELHTHFLNVVMAQAAGAMTTNMLLWFSYLTTILR